MAQNALHQSLLGHRTKETRMYNPDNELRLNDTALALYCGQLAHAACHQHIIAPLVNSYKRLVPGYERLSTVMGAHQS